MVEPEESIDVVGSAVEAVVQDAAEVFVFNEYSSLKTWIRESKFLPPWLKITRMMLQTVLVIHFVPA